MSCFEHSGPSKIQKLNMFGQPVYPVSGVKWRPSVRAGKQQLIKITCGSYQKVAGASGRALSCALSTSWNWPNDKVHLSWGRWLLSLNHVESLGSDELIKWSQETDYSVAARTLVNLNARGRLVGVVEKPFSTSLLKALCYANKFQFGRKQECVERGSQAVHKLLPIRTSSKIYALKSNIRMDYVHLHVQKLQCSWTLF